MVIYTDKLELIRRGECYFLGLLGQGKQCWLKLLPILRRQNLLESLDPSLCKSILGKDLGWSEMFFDLLGRIVRVSFSLMKSMLLLRNGLMHKLVRIGKFNEYYWN